MPYGWHLWTVAMQPREALFCPILHDKLLQGVPEGIRRAVARWNVDFCSTHQEAAAWKPIGEGLRHWLAAAE